jgi:histone H3/H4
MTKFFKRFSLFTIMAKRENILPYAPLGAFMAEVSGKRISKDAKETAAQLLEEKTAEIVMKAQLLAEHSGRKTIKGKDILLAYQQLK